MNRTPERFEQWRKFVGVSLQSGTTLAVDPIPLSSETTMKVPSPYSRGIDLLVLGKLDVVGLK